MNNSNIRLVLTAPEKGVASLKVRMLAHTGRNEHIRIEENLHSSLKPRSPKIPLRSSPLNRCRDRLSTCRCSSGVPDSTPVETRQVGGRCLFRPEKNTVRTDVRIEQISSRKVQSQANLLWENDAADFIHGNSQ